MDAAITTSDPPPPLAVPRSRSRSGVARPSMPPRAELSPESLQRAQAGERAAIEEFVRCYQTRLFAFLSRASGRGPHVEDLAQEVLLRVLRALPSYRPGGSKLSSWIFQVAVRLVIDEGRRQKPVLLEAADEVSSRDVLPEAKLHMRRQLKTLQGLMAELPDEQRVVLVLAEFDGLPQAEIAEVAGVPVATVKTRLHRARAQLRRGMAQAGYPLKEGEA